MNCITYISKYYNLTNKSIEKMQSFFVFGGGGTIAKFKSKLSLCWSWSFH